MASSWEDTEATNVFYDTDEIIRRTVETFYSLKLSCDVCVDAGLSSSNFTTTI